jgi:hypothetical protein
MGSPDPAAWPGSGTGYPLGHAGGKDAENLISRGGNGGENLGPARGGMVVRNWPPKGGMLLRTDSVSAAGWIRGGVALSEVRSGAGYLRRRGMTNRQQGRRCTSAGGASRRGERLRGRRRARRSAGSVGTTGERADIGGWTSRLRGTTSANGSVRIARGGGRRRCRPVLSASQVNARVSATRRPAGSGCHELACDSNRSTSLMKSWRNWTGRCRCHERACRANSGVCTRRRRGWRATGGGRGRGVTNRLQVKKCRDSRGITRTELAAESRTGHRGKAE